MNTATNMESDPIAEARMRLKPVLQNAKVDETVKELMRCGDVSAATATANTARMALAETVALFADLSPVLKSAIESHQIAEREYQAYKSGVGVEGTFYLIDGDRLQLIEAVESFLS